jgi:hypothetical protein
MAYSIFSLIPDPEKLLALEPEELAGVLLEYLNDEPDGSSELNRITFSLPKTVREYPPDDRKSVLRALLEAWAWLEREGLLVTQPYAEKGGGGDGVFISRRGKRLKKS